jgi:Ca-activated chloride channel family protein
VLAVFYLLLQRRRKRFTASFSGLAIPGVAKGRRLGFRRHIPPALFLGALSILLVAFARPQTVVSMPRREGTVILTFDVSGSMAADDFKPTRIEAAKAAAREFIDRQPREVQIGIVAFSDNGFSVQVPTNDKDSLLAAINRLSPQRGTSLANGILASLNAINAISGKPASLTYSNLPSQPGPTPTPVPRGTYIPAAIILLSDGQNNENPDPLTAARAAIDRGVRVYTVGIGSAAGTTLHINGFNIFTQLNEQMLKEVSQVSDGAYYNAENQEDLLKIYENLGTQLVVKPEKTEVTSLFAGAGIFILLLGGVFSMVWLNRLP